MTENNGGIVDALGDPGASNCGVGRGDGHAGGGMCGGGLIDRSVAEIQPTAVGGSICLTLHILKDHVMALNCSLCPSAERVVGGSKTMKGWRWVYGR